MTLRNCSILLFIGLLSITLKAQTDTTKKIVSDKLNHFSYGVNFNQYGGDFGMGLDVTSSYFDVSDNHDGAEFAAFRLSGSENITSGVPEGETNSTAFGYSVIRLGLIDRKFIIPKKIALILEEGVTAVLPSTKMSSSSVRWGGYIMPSVEFYSSPGSSIMFQMGAAINQPCIADKLVGAPQYYVISSPNGFGIGFLVSVVLRRYF